VSSIVRADEKLTAFVELELAICSQKGKMKTMKTMQSEYWHVAGSPLPRAA
jgi:hypothetical protein